MVSTRCTTRESCAHKLGDIQLLAPPFAIYIGNLVDGEFFITGDTVRTTREISCTQTFRAPVTGHFLDGLKLKGEAVVTTHYVIIDPESAS